MKKKLFIIIGLDAEFEAAFIRKVIAELSHQNYVVEKINSDDLKSLETTLALLEQDEAKDYSNYFVLYAGLNLRYLQDDLPCDHLNASLLFRKLCEVVGTYKTEAQKKMVFDLFLGGVAMALKK